MTTLFRVAKGVCSRLLDGETAVYISGRFETHLLDDAGSQVLEAVSELRNTAAQCSTSAIYQYLLSGSASMLVNLDDHSQETVDSTETIGHLSFSAEEESDAALLPMLTELVQLGVLTSQTC